MKIDRLFSIVQILVNKKTVTAAELAEYFGVSIRTIYRDIEVLSANNVPIYCSQGKGGGISILDSYLIDKTLLSDNEQNQILSSLQSLKETGKVDVETSLIKLSNLFNKKDVDWIKIDFSKWEENDKEDEKFEVLKQSIIDSRFVKFLYFSNSGEMTERIVEPVRLVFKGYRWYIYGFCKLRNDYRFFKLSRIEKLKMLDETFVKRKDIVINTDYYTDCGELIDVKFKINKKMASRVYDEFRNDNINLDGNSFLVEAKIPKNPYIYTYLLSYGDDLVILEPKFLIDNFKRILKSILEKY